MQFSQALGNAITKEYGDITFNDDKTMWTAFFLDPTISYVEAAVLGYVSNDYDSTKRAAFKAIKKV